MKSLLLLILSITYLVAYPLKVSSFGFCESYNQTKSNWSEISLNKISPLPITLYRTGENSHITFLVGSWQKLTLGPKSVLRFQTNKKELRLYLQEGRVVMVATSDNQVSFNLHVGPIVFSMENGAACVEALGAFRQITAFQIEGKSTIAPDFKSPSFESVFDKILLNESIKITYLNGRNALRSYDKIPHDDWYFAFPQGDEISPGMLKEVHKW